jgi:hypothetical protein
MSLPDLASLGSFVSGVAVLASLVFLFFQMRQMTEQVKQAERNQRAQMQQGRADRVGANTLTLATDADAASIFTRGRAGDETLNSEELERFILMCRLGFISGEDSYLQHMAGALDATAFESFTAGLRQYMRLPGLRAAWRMGAQEYGPGYRDFMDKILAETSVGAPSDALARWKTALAVDRKTANLA